MAIETLDKLTQVLQSTIVAYSDANEITDEERNLDYKAEYPVTPLQAAAIMEIALSYKGIQSGGYNEFSAKLLLKLPESSEVWLAREGSVCVYVKVSNDIAFTKRGLKCDEFDVESVHVDADSTGRTYRIWWD